MIGITALNALVVASGIVLVLEQKRDADISTSIDSDSEEEPITYYYEKQRASPKRLKKLKKLNKAHGWFLSALAFGSLLFLTHYFLTAPSVILRFVGMNST